MLGENEDFLHECFIEMFPEDGCLSAYDNFPATEMSEHIVLFSEDGIENLKYIAEAHRDLNAATGTRDLSPHQD